jgi:hypothetical protein
MKKIIPFLLFIALVGCGKKEWSKDYLVKKCNSEMKKNTEVSGLISTDKVEKICDCVAAKMLVKYKSESAANKDKSGAEEIGKECAMDVMMPKE